MKITTLAATAAIVLASALPVGAQMQPPQPQQPQPAQPAQQPMPAQQAAAGTVTLLTANKQGPSGSAQVTQQGSDVVITIHAMQDQTTAAILSGKCTGSGKPDAAGPAQPLKPLVNGTSETTIPNTTVAALSSTPHIIVVQGGATPTLCGDVSSLAPAAAPPKK